MVFVLPLVRSLPSIVSINQHNQSDHVSQRFLHIKTAVIFETRFVVRNANGRDMTSKKCKQMKLIYETQYDESDTATEQELASRVSFLLVCVLDRAIVRRGVCKLKLVAYDEDLEMILSISSEC